MSTKQTTTKSPCTEKTEIDAANMAFYQIKVIAEAGAALFRAEDSGDGPDMASLLSAIANIADSGIIIA